MPGFDNNTMYADNVDFSGSTTPAPSVTLNGQLLIGSTATPHIKVATLTAGAGITITNASGSITIAASGGGGGSVSGLIPDAHTAPGTTPVIGDGGGNITITGDQVGAGVVGINCIRTDSLAANTMTVQIQRSTSAAFSTTADNGVSHYDSGVFSVDVDGFVSLLGGGIPPAQTFTVDAVSGTGVNPVVPSSTGNITIAGASVGPGTIGSNVIQTESLSPHTFQIQVQESDVSFGSNTFKNGVAHFDASVFTADTHGYISLVGGSVPPTQKVGIDAHTAPGTSPVVPTAGGLITFTGAQVPTGTTANVIRTDSIAANTVQIEVQRSTAVAGSDVTKNGVSHFNSAQFTVDANGFVSSVGAGGAGWTFIQTQTFAAVANVIFNTNLSNFTELMFQVYNLQVPVISGPQPLIEFNVSPDNGVTKIMGYCTSSAVHTVNLLCWFSGQAGSPTNGDLILQNVSGSYPKAFKGGYFNSILANYSIFGGNIDPSNQINWIEFFYPTQTLTGTIVVWGR